MADATIPPRTDPDQSDDAREMPRQEQEHQIDLATALGEGVPHVSRTR